MPGPTPSAGSMRGAWTPVHRLVHDDVRSGSDGVHVLTVRDRRTRREPGAGGDRHLHARHHRAGRPAHRHRARRPEQQPDADLDLHRRRRQHRDLLARRRPVGRLHLAAPGRPQQRRRTASTSWPSAPRMPRATSGRRRPAPSPSIATAPEAPSITSAPSSPGSNATVSWSFTTPDGTTTRCRIDTGAGLQLRRLGDDDLHRRRPAPVHGGGRRPRRQPQRHHDGDVHARPGRPGAADDHRLAHDPGPGHHPPVDLRHGT